MIPSDEYSDLIAYLGQQFGQITVRFDALERRFDALQRRFDALERRVTKLEISFEQFRSDQRVLIEAIAANRAGIERNGEAIAALDSKVDRLDLRLTRLKAA